LSITPEGIWQSPFFGHSGHAEKPVIWHYGITVFGHCRCSGITTFSVSQTPLDFSAVFDFGTRKKLPIAVFPTLWSCGNAGIDDIMAFGHWRHYGISNAAETFLRCTVGGVTGSFVPRHE
jgi:hypothetical protein